MMKYNSISFKIILLTIITISVTICSIGIYDFISQSISLNNNIKEKKENLSQRISISISNHVWNLNQDSVKEIISYDMKDNEIYGIKLVENSGAVFYEVKRDDQWKVVEQPVLQDDIKRYSLIVSKSDLKNEDTVIGYIELYITKIFLNKTIQFIVIETIIKIVLIAIMSIIVLLIALDKMFISQVKKLNLNFKNISEGEGDLTVQLDIKSRDEIGDLSFYFNKFIRNLDLLIKNIKKISYENSSLGENLSSSTNAISATINQITSIMMSMSQKNEHLNNQLLKAKQAINEVDKYINKTVLIIEDQSSSITQSSASIEEMIANIINITGVAETKKNLSVELTTVAKEGKGSLINTISAINDISASVDVVTSMIDVINNVADQTNILAMNAAIEAAHAGEFGKGFSVVANEIRNLAETTGGNAKNISKSLKSIISQIKSTESISNKTNQVIYQLIEGIVQITNSMNEMLIGFKEINIGSTQITASLNNLIKITEDVNSSSKNIKNISSDINNSISVIYNLADDNKNAISEISSGINDIGNAINDLLKLSDENISQVKNLNDNVSKFKTSEN